MNQRVEEPGGAVEWCFDRNEQLYVRFVRRWINVRDRHDEVVDIQAAYSRDPAERKITPEGLSYLLQWIKDDGSAF